MRTKAKAGVIYGLTLAGTLAWLGAIMLAPYLRSRGARLNSLIYAVFAPTCHQIPSRSFYLWGFPLAVCGRCTGIYAGFLAGALALPFVRGLGNTELPRVWSLALATGPMAIDALGNFLGFWATGNPLRFSTGFLWGLILPFYLLAGLNSLFLGHEPYERHGAPQN
jgi:uncharacterized membrane protein